MPPRNNTGSSHIFDVDPTSDEFLQSVAREREAILRGTSFASAVVDSGTSRRTNHRKKIRHLDHDERDINHNPEPDFIDTPRGEVLINAAALTIDDIVEKHGLAFSG